MRLCGCAIETWTHVMRHNPKMLGTTMGFIVNALVGVAFEPEAMGLGFGKPVICFYYRMSQQPLTANQPTIG